VTIGQRLTVSLRAEISGTVGQARSI